ncbi:MAG TPA: hypothetical protein VGL72_29935 [Bryobacteraceae bacterium]|jgi:hypothetical protein
MSRITRERVNELKRMIATSADIGEAVKFFFDHFAESPGFMELGYPKELPDNVKTAVKQAIAKGLGQAAHSIEWSTIEIPELQIMHGSIVVDGKSGAVVWAPDIQTGIASFPKKAGSSELLSMRLSFTPASHRRQVH